MWFSKKQTINSSDRIVIVGAGEVGFHIARRLADEKKQVVVIDQDVSRLRRMEEQIDVQTVTGSGSLPSVLHEAGVEKASVFVAVTDSDESNILACLFANAIAPNAVKLARLRQPEYVAHADLLRSAALNISLLVNPEQEIVRTIDRLLTLPGAVEYAELAMGSIRMAGLRVEEGPLIGEPLTRFRDIVEDDGIMVGAITSGTSLVVPSGDSVIRKGDVVYFVYRPASQPQLLAALNRTRGFLNTACIIGGGNIGARLAALFEKKGIKTTLIEHDAARCEFLAAHLNDTLILHGDGTDKNLLAEEHVGNKDAFVAVTGDEETNILCCLLAKSMGAKETVVRVNKAAYLPLVEAVGIGHSVSPRLSAVNSILHYFRQGRVLASVSVGGEAAEALEVLVADDSKLVGRQVFQLGLPRGALLLAVTRGDDVFVPSGSTVIHAQDHLVLLGLRDVMNAVEKMLAEKMPSAHSK